MFEKTVDKVLAALTKTVTDLGAIETAAKDQVTYIDEQIEGLARNRVAVTDEAEKARRIGARLQELLA